MANPSWQFQDGFESGDASAWDISKTDTGGFLDFPHYTELARISGMGMPYSGAYCMRIDYTGSTAVAHVGDDAIDIADGHTIWCRFNLFIDKNITSSDNDTITFLTFRQTDNSAVWGVGIQLDSSGGAPVWLVIDASSSVQSTSTVELGCWYTVELKVNVQTGAATGECELYVTKEGTVPTSTKTLELTGEQSPAPVLNALFGVVGVHTSTRGYFLLDNLVTTADGGSRIWPDADRFSTTKEITRTEHVFLGAGTVSGVQLSDGGSNDTIVTVYDTDIGQVGSSNKKLMLSATAETQVVASSIPFDVIRGCYVVLEGTDPEAIIHIDRAPNWFSEGNIRRFANRR